MIISKFCYGISLIISFFYGFIILLILNMVNHKVNFTPIFRYPSIRGIINGTISFVFYCLTIMGLYHITKMKNKEETKWFIFANLIVFVFGLILFFGMGAVFFVETPNYA